MDDISMRPPICAICGKKWVCVLIEFKMSDEGREFEEKAKRGFVGHPPDSEWFCFGHAMIARKYAHLHLDEAMERIRSGT